MCTSEVNTRAQRKRANKEGLPKRAQNGRSNGVFKTADHKEGKKEGTDRALKERGQTRRGHKGHVKRAREGTKRAKPETTNRTTSKRGHKKRAKDIIT